MHHLTGTDLLLMTHCDSNGNLRYASMLTWHAGMVCWLILVQLQHKHFKCSYFHPNINIELILWQVYLVRVDLVAIDLVRIDLLTRSYSIYLASQLAKA